MGQEEEEKQLFTVYQQERKKFVSFFQTKQKEAFIPFQTLENTQKVFCLQLDNVLVWVLQKGCSLQEEGLGSEL